MRRISLALALMGAVAATGCGQSAKSTDGGNRGVAEGTFKVTVQNGQDGNTSLAITGGYVTSVPAGIDCGVSPHSACSFEFPAGTAVTISATATTGNNFWGYAGDCYTSGNVCTLSGKADQYVLARFGAGVPDTAHANWSPGLDPTLHSAQASALLSTIPLSTTFPWQCAACHGSALTGMGMAPSCASCHGGSSQVVAPATTAVGETCTGCHAGQGAIHQVTYDKFTDASKLEATIVSVVSTPNVIDPTKFDVTVTFDLKKNGTAYAATITGFAQKTVYVTKYDPATKKFMPSTSLATLAAVSGTPGRYTAKNNLAASTPVRVAFAPESSNSMVYMYFAENPTLIPAKGNYKLYDDVASAAKVYGTLDYVSTANVSACENCHGAPYQKHGYRAGRVAGLPDLAACKACHYDNRVGSDKDWQCLAENPAAFAAGTCATTTPWVSGWYEYTANVMNDTHMSHAMEFEFPQSMSVCSTCHAGKLDQVLTDANFNLTTCKSCHPVVAAVPAEGRAPPLNPAGVLPAVLPAYHDIDRTTGLVGGHACNECHNDHAKSYDGVTVTNWLPTDPEYSDGLGPTFVFGTTSEYVPLFKEIHSGVNSQIYAANGTRYADTIKAQISSASFDASTNVLTVNFSVAGANAGAVIKPTVVMSLYGYDTKDFIVSGHGSQPAPDGKRNLEWAEGSTSNSPRLTVTGTGPWVATADLTLWASKLADGSVKKLQIGVLPVLGLDQAAVVSTTNPAIAIAGATKTFDLVGAAGLTDAPVIVDPAKCNKCHDALGTTFHSPSYGSAGVVACRLCHVPGNGGSHLEMQSRSIDSYVHSIHSMQAFDVKNVNFADPVQALWYELKTEESTYPNFTTLSCESCHNPGTYEAPANDHALPAVLSASAVVTEARAIGGVPSVVTGPASKACGGCHRAMLINEDNAAGLSSFDAHTKAFGYRETANTGVWDAIINNVFP